VYSRLEAAPPDPILGVTEAYSADPSPDKVNLGVGIYLDETGQIPLLECVEAVEEELTARKRPRGYLPIDGMASFNRAVQVLVFGADSPAVTSGRVATVQSLAGTGALRVGAGLLALSSPGRTVLLSAPSWENHRLLFSRARFQIARYRYYDPVTRGVDHRGLIEDLSAAEPGTIVVLHACCHNPTGCDLTEVDWSQVIEVVQARGLVPFLDFAYQGFSRGVEPDRYGVDALVRVGVPFLVANSFSKNFSLYGERIGAIHFVTGSAAEAAIVDSQAKTVVRSLYSNPATQGAAIVSMILNSPARRAKWEAELRAMRHRIIDMRHAFRAGLAAAGVEEDLSYITSQTGMFSYSGLSIEQMRRLRSEFHVYGLDSGRLCMAALNPGNIERVVEAVGRVMVPA
jgi:aromatic-amino-acid transaminase